MQVIFWLKTHFCLRLRRGLDHFVVILHEDGNASSAIFAPDGMERFFKAVLLKDSLPATVSESGKDAEASFPHATKALSPMTVNPSGKSARTRVEHHANAPFPINCNLAGSWILSSLMHQANNNVIVFRKDLNDCVVKTISRCYIIPSVFCYGTN